MAEHLSDRVNQDRCWNILKSVILAKTGLAPSVQNIPAGNPTDKTKTDEQPETDGERTGPAYVRSTGQDMDGVGFYAFTEQAEFPPHIFTPSVVVVAQGTKILRTGTEEFRYGENVYFLCGAEIPVYSCIPEASPVHPYLALSLTLNMAIVKELSAQMHRPLENTPCTSIATTQKLDADLLDAFTRLAELTMHAHPSPVLARMLIQEIHCRLLESPFGPALYRLTTQGSHENQIYRSLAWLKENFAATVSVTDLARQVNMAPSTYHKYFKGMTSFSPLQYQKRLRLHEARRLMLADGLDVAQAAMRVGYESTTQFIREYKRLYGKSPKKDTTLMKASQQEEKGVEAEDGTV